MKENECDPLGAADEPRYGDEETAAASGVPLPSLRVLQAAGAVRSVKTPKTHGGFRRMWSEADVLKASIAAALGEHFAWNIRLTAEVMANGQPPLWRMLVDAAVSDAKVTGPTPDVSPLVVSAPLDWRIELIDRTFLFFEIPDEFTVVVPGIKQGQRTLLLGMVTGARFLGLSWELATPRGRDVAREALGPEGADKAMRLYKVAIVARGNCLSMASINLGMNVRAAWRRLHGLESRFLQQAVRIGKGDTQS